jgi:hypothetical protein
MSNFNSTDPGQPRHIPTTGPQSAARTKLQFHRSLKELQDLVLLTEDNGEWMQKPNGVWRYRSKDGGGLNWSSTRGTLWFDGPTGPRDRLQRIIRARLDNEQNSSPV